MQNIKLRNTLITIFVIFWTVLFHYESIRYFYLQPMFGKPLPKTKFLFPPAGWIMFYHVDDSFAHASVIGINDDGVQEIDPHRILATRTFGFDNIHRNILGTVGYADQARPFCRFLRFRFPQFEKFLVTAVYYPSVTSERIKKFQEVQYQCTE